MNSMKRATLVALILLLASVAVSEEPGPKTKAFIEAGKEALAGQIRRVTNEITSDKEKLALARKGTIRRGESARVVGSANGKSRVYVFGSPQEKQQTIARITAEIAQGEAKLDALKKAEYIPPKITVDQLAVGQIGIVVYPSGVVGDEPYRADISFQPVKAEILQIVDGQNMIVKTFGKHTLWLRSDTAGLVDGKELTLDEPLEVTGTKTYQTAIGGSNTVFVLVPFKAR